MSAQSPEEPRLNLTAAEIAAVKRRHGENVRVSAYRVEGARRPAERRESVRVCAGPGRDDARRAPGTPLDGLDALAEEFGVNVAVLEQRRSAEL